MRRSLKLTVSDWPEALCLLALLLLTIFVIPHAPKVIGGVFGLLISVGALWAMVEGVRARWRSSPGTGCFVAYYARLALLGLVIVVAWFAIIYIVARWFTVS